MAKCPRCGKELQVDFDYDYGGDWLIVCPEEHLGSVFAKALAGQSLIKIKQAMLEAGQKLLDEVDYEEADT